MAVVSKYARTITRLYQGFCNNFQARNKLFEITGVIAPLESSAFMSTAVTSQAHAEINIRREGKVAVLTMLDHQNRINFIFCKKWLEALDEVEKWDVDALVTVGVGKFYSTGFDTAYLLSADNDERKRFWREFVELSNRLLHYPMVTISAINGHSVAAGAVLSLVHDYRVQQKNCGWIYMNEVDMGIPLPPFIKALFHSKLTPQMIRDIYVYGKRFNADMSYDLGLVDKISEEGKVIETSIEYAKVLTEDGRYKRQNLYQVKNDIYGDVIFDDSDFVVPNMNLLPK